MGEMARNISPPPATFLSLVSFTTSQFSSCRHPLFINQTMPRQHIISTLVPRCRAPGSSCVRKGDAHDFSEPTLAPFLVLNLCPRHFVCPTYCFFFTFLQLMFRGGFCLECVHHAATTRSLRHESTCVNQSIKQLSSLISLMITRMTNPSDVL